MRITPRNIFIVCSACVLIIGFILLTRSAGNAQQEDTGAVQPRSGIRQVHMNPADLKQTPGPAPLTAQDEAKAKIAEYQEKIEAEPKSENAPALIFATGNLYLQKIMDYEEAAHCFEALIEKYPDAPNTREAYVQLSTCYELLNDQEKLNRLHNDMMKKFPPDSQEYLYAQSKLGS